MKEIAKIAGVSQSTVSRVMNGNSNVRTDVRERVLRIAKELEYVPNMAARTLVGERSYTIGFIIPDITNPFFPEVVQSAESEITHRGYSLMLSFTGWNMRLEKERLTALRAKKVDGAIIGPLYWLDDLAEDLKKTGFTSVIVGKPLPGFDSVHTDNLKGGYIAGKHLIDCGHNSIACIGPPTHPKTMGFRKALAESHVAIDERLIRLDERPGVEESWIDVGYRTTLHLLSTNPRPTAILALADMYAVGAVRAIEEAGLRIPEDVAVVGYDDTFLASVMKPKLTSVSQQRSEMGRLAAELLIDRIEGIKAGPPVEMVLEPRLVVRESSTKISIRPSE